MKENRITNLRYLVSNGLIKEAYDQLDSIYRLKESDSYNTVLQQKGRIADLDRRYLMGFISNEERSIEYSKISRLVLDVFIPEIINDEAHILDRIDAFFNNYPSAEKVHLYFKDLPEIPMLTIHHNGYIQNTEWNHPEFRNSLIMTYLEPSTDELGIKMITFYDTFAFKGNINDCFDKYNEIYNNFETSGLNLLNGSGFFLAGRRSDITPEIKNKISEINKGNFIRIRSYDFLIELVKDYRAIFIKAFK